MGQGKTLGAKLFLEGIEVPFIGSTNTHSIGQASISYIDLVPQQEINDIKPRTLVHIFVRNYNDEANGYPYVLAFSGEVFGFQFGRTATSRTFSISAIDFSSYWDNVMAFFLNAQQTGGKGTQEFTGLGQEIADIKRQGQALIATITPQASYFRKVINDKINEGGNFLDGFIEVYKSIADINEFYKYAEDKLRIIDRILINSSGKLGELLEGAEALEWFTGVVGRRTGRSTLRMVINDLMSLIFHDFVSVPFPARVVKDGIDNPLPSVKKIDRTIGQFIFKPNLYMIPPPMCNIFFPDEYSSFQYGRDFFREPTRLTYKPELPARLGGGAAAARLPHVYEPEAFNAYMLRGEKSSYSEFQGSGDTQIPEGYDPGFYGAEDTSEFSASNSGVKRDAQFLTNEERMKGIFEAHESMLPATTQFRQHLDEFKTNFVPKVAKYLFYKKRFEQRQLQITSHLKLSVVPGFTALILDDSEGDQNVIAYCSSVTHRIYATEGGYTNVSLSYARHVTEQDISSSFGNNPLVPPWFDEAVFGSVKSGESEAASDEVKDNGVTLVSTDALSQFYASLLGEKGSQAITNYFKKERTLLGATRKLLDQYAYHKKQKTQHDFIARLTNRDYIKMKDAFSFIGAKTSTKDVDSADFTIFTGDSLTRKGKDDETVVTLRRNVITRYRNALRERRGFRG